MRATGFRWQATLFELNIRKTSARWSNKADKIYLTACQFAQCLAFNKTPGSGYGSII